MSLLFEATAEQQEVFRVFYAIFYWTHRVDRIFKIMLEYMEVEFAQPHP